MQKRRFSEQELIAARARAVLSEPSFFKPKSNKATVLEPAPTEETAGTPLLDAKTREPLLAERMGVWAPFIAENSEIIDAQIRALIEETKGPEGKNFTEEQLKSFRMNQTVLYYYFHYLLPSTFELLIQQQTADAKSEKLEQALRALENAALQFCLVYRNYDCMPNTYQNFLNQIILFKVELIKLQQNFKDEEARRVFHQQLKSFHEKYKIPSGDKCLITADTLVGMQIGLCISMLVSVAPLILADISGATLITAATAITLYLVTLAIGALIGAGVGAYYGWQNYQKSIEESKKFTDQVEQFNSAISEVIPAPATTPSL